jgi:hypothetical protein
VVRGGIILRDENAWHVKLTTHIHPVPTSRRLCASLPPHPHTYLIYLEHKGTFTFYLFYVFALTTSIIIIRMIKEDEMGRECCKNGDKRNAYRIVVGKSECKRPLGRPRRRWVENIKMDLREVGWDGMDWIDLAHDRDQWRALANTVISLPVP